jgi:hypothetical protein
MMESFSSDDEPLPMSNMKMKNIKSLLPVLYQSARTKTMIDEDKSMASSSIKTFRKRKSLDTNKMIKRTNYFSNDYGD